ncbi:diguanylate cyclase [Massilia sp. YIM B02763]|uniref:sensor domain-containing diguanylate cyclase n=1 Tax=Massilia sp. YIM B02763 TaxID=3050130 RepID=UPI0025B71C41|nr:diguanylate cyclase [Massilia sp. YIM B02763]MDN4053056.1 diguanylate cyclase [Massilia sp. YIM B02763]
MLSQQELAEEQRIKALHSLGVLDTPQEDRFDRFTRLASAAFGVPIALVSLVDNNRQWFKSGVGFHVCETPRDIAMCSHTVALDELLVVSDTLADERFRDFPYVRGEKGIRFYAGQPLHSLDGQPVGTLCILDLQPRDFGVAERRMLRDLAQMVQDELNRRVVVAARDAAQQALRELNAQLEKRVAERTRELHAKNEALQHEMRQRAAAESALRQKQELLDAVLESVEVAVVACDAQGRLTLFNRAAREFHDLDASGVSAAEWPAHYHLYGEDGVTPLKESEIPLLRALHGERILDTAMTIGIPGRPARHLLASGRPIQGAGGEPLGAVVAMQDITELAASRSRIIESEEWLRTIADNVPALIAYIDTDLRYRFANQRYQEWFGVRSEHMIGKTVPEAMGEAFYEPRRAALARCLSGHGSHLEIEEQRRGRTRVISSTYLPHIREGRVQGIYVLSTDATSAREYERQLHALAHSDHLTGLPNRRSYEERLAQAIARSRRSAMPLALCYLDVDHFKQINDTFGHAVGDAVLREFAKRLSGTVRSTDTVARLAGDEFVIVLEQVGSPLECQRVADKLLEAIRPPFQVDGRTLDVTSSLGFAWCPRPELAALTHAADDALYQSKRAGRDRSSVVVLAGCPA